jgi:glutathione S-transferase
LELKVVDNPVAVETLSFPQLKSPEHLARNPMGSSPAFTDQDHEIAIWESGAVLTYLLEIYDTNFELYPQPGKATPSERAKFLHLQQFVIATVYPFLASLFIHTFKPKEEQDHDYVENAKLKWRTVLAPILVQFLGDSPYFMGEKMSAIDLLVAKPFNNANSLGLLAEFPTLDAVYQKIRSLASFEEAYGDKQEARIQGRSMLLVPSDGEDLGGASGINAGMK